MASISSLGIGSGLDLNGLLDQLQEAERGKLEPIERQLETQQTKIYPTTAQNTARKTGQYPEGTLQSAEKFNEWGIKNNAKDLHLHNMRSRMDLTPLCPLYQAVVARNQR